MSRLSLDSLEDSLDGFTADQLGTRVTLYVNGAFTNGKGPLF